MTSTGLPVVLVHLGHPNRWLGPSLKGLVQFAGRDVVLVADHPDSISLAQSVGSGHFEMDQRVLGEFTATDPETDEFRSGFWVKTSQRFDALALYQETVDLPVLHIESDVTLFPALKLSAFLDLGDVAAFPRRGLTSSTAAVFYSGSSSVTRSVADTIRSQGALGPAANDMTGLFLWAENHARSYVELPSLAQYCLTPQKWIKSTQRFGGTFDALPLGQYLLGTDPRNGRGFRYVLDGDACETEGAGDPQAWTYSMQGQDLVVSVPGDDALIPVLNLHVHSKDLRAFEAVSRTRLLLDRVSESSPRREFDYWAFIFALKAAGQKHGSRLAHRLLRRDDLSP